MGAIDFANGKAAFNIQPKGPAKLCSGLADQAERTDC